MSISDFEANAYHIHRSDEPMWFHDCGGKKSLDVMFAHSDTRFWPRGGSHTVWLNGVVQDKDMSEPPSCVGSIHVGSTKLSEFTYTGTDNEETMRKLEEWTANEAKFIEDTLTEAYAKRAKETA